VVRPHRYALALAPHLTLGDGDVAMHDVCDLPLCVRAEATGGHIVLGTHSENLTRIGGAPVVAVAVGTRGGGTGPTVPLAPPAPAHCARPSATVGTTWPSEKR